MASTSRLEGFLSIAVAVLTTVSVLSASPARAATDAEQAEALIREGVRLRAHDNAAQALPLFEKAYQIVRTPRTAAQLGLCELELGFQVLVPELEQQCAGFDALAVLDGQGCDLAAERRRQTRAPACIDGTGTRVRDRCGDGAEFDGD